MRITPELPDVSAQPGRKIAVGVGCYFRESMSGNRVLRIGFVIVHSKENDAGALLIENFVLTQASAWKLAKWAGATKYTQEFDPENSEDVEKILANGPLILNLVEDEYNGKTGVKVKGFEVFGGDMRDQWNNLVMQGENKFQEIVERSQNGLTGNIGSGNSSRNVSTNVDDIPF